MGFEAAKSITCDDFEVEQHRMAHHLLSFLFKTNLFVLVNDHGGNVPPWEEDNGFYGILVRLLFAAVFLGLTVAKQFDTAFS